MPNEAGGSSTKGLLPGEVKVQPGKTILPSGKEVSSGIFERKDLQRKMGDWGRAVVPSIFPGRQEVINIHPDRTRGYWEDPRRIARYHTFIRNAPPDWQKPDWLDVNTVEAAHKYFTEYQGSDWTKWKFLPEEDYATRWLRDMDMPPPEFLFPEETEAVMQQEQINTWDDLHLYQQAGETLMTPQPITYDNATGRPSESIWTANILRSSIQALSGLGMGTMAAKLIVGGAAAAAGSPALAIGGTIGTAAFFLGSMYQFKTGEKMPVIGDIIETFGVASILGRLTEKFGGTAAQVADMAIDTDTEQIMEELPEAFKVADAFYEVAPTQYTPTHLWQLGAEALNLEGARESRAEPGEVYRWDLGMPDPQKLPEGYKFGVDALEDMRVQLIALGEDDDGSGALAIIQDYKNQFGSQGAISDFVAQAILDPMNYMPTIGHSIMRGKYKRAGDMVGLEAFPPVTGRNVVVDGLPVPLNMIVPIVTGGKWSGTPGLVDGLMKLQVFYKTGYMQGYQGTPEDFVPPKDYSPGQKALGELSDKGMPKEYMPFEPIETGPLPGARNFFKKMVSLTPEAKAEYVYSNFLDYMGNIAMRSADPDMVVKLLKTAGNVDTETTAQAFADIMKPLGMQEGDALVNNYVHPIGAAFADSFRKLNGDDFIDNYKINMWDMTADRRAILDKAAKLLEINPHDLLDQLGKDVDIAGALKIQAAEKGLEGFESITNQTLKETMSVFGGKNPMPIDVNEFNFMLVNKYGDMLSDHINARFGIGKDSTFKKFAGVLKDVQSILVLDYNPGYFINNAANNILWSSAHGSYGLTSRSRMVSFLERLEITPTRMDMGFSEDSRVRTDFGIDSDGKVTKVSDIVKAEKDILSVAGSAVKDVRRKLGIFNRLSSMSEMSTSRQIYYKAIRNMQSQLWRRGHAIRPLPDTMNKLPEEIKNRIYETMEKSYNSKEVDGNFFTGASKLTVSEISGRVFERFLGNYEDGMVDIDSIREMAYTTGMIDEIDSVLANAKTPTDIDNGFAEVEGRLQDTIQKAMTDELLVRVEDVKTRVQTEGVKVILSELSDVEMQKQRIWVRKDEDFIDLFSRDMDKSERSRQYKILRRRHDRQFASVNDWRKVTLEGIYEAIGIGKDNPSVKVILEANKDSEGAWNEALLFRDEAYKPLFEETFENQKSYDIAKAEIDRKVQEKFDYAQASELNNLNKKNEAYISLAKDKEAARAWTEEYTKAVKEMADIRKEYLQELRDNPPANQMEKSYRWQEFFRKEHEPMIRVIQSLAGNKKGMVEEVQSVRLQMDADAKTLDTIINEGGKPEETFQDAQQLKEIYDYWANDWLAKNTVKEMFDNTARYSDDQIVNIMSLYEFRAEQWARDTGNNPREWWNKYIREIKYADDPEQVMHELFQTGETSSTWYYSNLLRTIEGMPNRMPADQMKGWLKGKVKKEEMGDTGFDQWLKQQDGMVEKSDVLDFLSENAVRVEEIIFGAESPEYIKAKEGLLPYLNRSGAAYQALRRAYNNSPEVVEVSIKIANGEMTPEEFTKLPESVKTFAKEYESSMKAKAEYEDYLNKLPGKTNTTKYDRPSLLTEGEHENYRELLLTLPLKKPMFPEGARYIPVIDGDVWRIKDLEEGSYLLEQGSTRNTKGFTTYEDAAADANRNNHPSGYDEVPYSDQVGAFRDGHWTGQPNVLAHIRYNDRIDADGKKVLYIEEFQSDWHQKGRDVGYKKSFTAEEIETKKNRMREIQKELLPDLTDPEAYKLLSDELDVLSNDISGNPAIVPDAPFKKSWNSLSMKRMIRWAVENGYDRVAWTPGEIQADRYNLANYYNRLEFIEDVNTGNKKLIATSNGGDKKEFQIDNAPLENYVGKELAQKLSSEEYYTGDFGSTKVHVIEGDSMQIGGEGMKAFYDKIMVSDTNKLIKKYGVKVGETLIEVGEGLRNTGEVSIRQAKILFNDGEIIASVRLNENDPNDYSNQMQVHTLDALELEEARGRIFIHLVSDNPIVSVHSFDITDSMRQKAIEGLPLYQRDLDIYSLANKYGIATATADGKPNNKQLLNTINKYGDTKYKKIDEVPIDIAHKALEIRRLEKGDAPVKDALIKGAVSFDEEGAALMRLGEAADISTVVHETGHMFRRQLSGDDLEVIAKWTGLDSAEEMVKLEQQFDNSTIDEINRKRYIESEEKFAEGFEKYLTTEHKNLPQKIQVVFARFAQWLMGVFNSLSKKHDMDINATVDVNGRQVRIKDVLDRMFVKLEGENPLGTTPQPMPMAKSLSDGAYDYMYPLLDTMKQVYKENYQDYQALTIDDIPDNMKSDFTKWVNLSKQDLAATKLTSMKYAEAKRDHLLHNYSRRTGFDELLSYPFPYMFWYTKSMMKWGAAMLDQPKLYATHARYKEMQKEMERQGIPNRMRGKMRLNAPYLPDWMGGGLWQDPMKQLFPFAQMEDPAKRQGWMENSLKHEAYKVLDGYVKEGIITKDQAVAAKESQSGQLWDSARSEAGERLGTFDAVSLASIMASPAMYIDIPWKLAKGQADKISPTPLMKTSQAVETLTQDTMFSGLGKLVGGIGKAEEGLRRIKMTPAIAMFGEYGDYYVDRQLSNMVADGEVSIEQARMAMVERTGEVYAAAVNRVREEVALRIPGAAAVMAAKNGANIPQFGAAVFHSLNPSGLLPTGELEYLNLKDDYSYAWDMYNKGYKDQLTEFFEDHPVFEARIAIKDDPDERLQNFLVSEIWDRYHNLDTANKQLVHNQLGPDFSDTFMELRVYDAIPIDKLALWAHSIGGMVPQVEGGPMVGDMPQVEQWSADAANSYQIYSDTRNQQFPNWYAIEQKYFDQPYKKRKSYLANHPELKEYWDWKNAFRSAHPEVEPIMAYKSAQYQQENANMKSEMLQAMPEELTMQLQSYSLLGTNMGPGAWESLRYVWEKSGKPYGNLKKWVDEEIVNVLR